MTILGENFTTEILHEINLFSSKCFTTVLGFFQTTNYNDIPPPQGDGRKKSFSLAKILLEIFKQIAGKELIGLGFVKLLSFLSFLPFTRIPAFTETTQIRRDRTTELTLGNKKRLLNR